jgi:hypothetical protein
MMRWNRIAAASWNRTEKGWTTMTDEPFSARTADDRRRVRRSAASFCFAFERHADRAPVSCELRFQGEWYGWETQFFETGEILISRDGFPLRALAAQRADQQRRAIGQERWRMKGNPPLIGKALEAPTDPLAGVQVRLLGLPDEHAVTRRDAFPLAESEL